MAGREFEITLPLLEVMTELAARGRGDAVAVESGPRLSISGAPSSCERESDIFDDERDADAFPASEVLSREAVQRGGKKEPVNNPNTSSDAEEDLISLTADVDESIEQLNQLILDLDPTFVPVPTHCSPLARSTSLHTNGISPTGQMHQSGES